jgi:hypothetical protein
MDTKEEAMTESTVSGRGGWSLDDYRRKAHRAFETGERVVEVGPERIEAVRQLIQDEGYDGRTRAVFEHLVAALHDQQSFFDDAPQTIQGDLGLHLLSEIAETLDHAMNEIEHIETFRQATPVRYLPADYEGEVPL